MKRLKKILLVIWQFPQEIIGCFLILMVKGKRKYINVLLPGKQSKYGLVGVYTVPNLFNSGISLGSYIIFDGRIEISETDVLHEYGHQLQSRMLGPLYLLIVGIPSLIGNIYSRIKKKDEKWYYSRFPENWADRLGGVNRDML